MQYFVKRGRTYVCPTTHALTQQGCEVTGKIDQSQAWKLQPGQIEQRSDDVKIVKKKAQTFDEATAALVKRRDEVTKARREARSVEQVKEVAAAQAEASMEPSNSVKQKPPIEPDDYKFDEMDLGEET